MNEDRLKAENEKLKSDLAYAEALRNKAEDIADWKEKIAKDKRSSRIGFGVLFVMIALPFLALLLK
jgi:hypothetical protein